VLYFHKLLPSLFLPIGLTLVLVGAGLVFRKQILCWAGLGLLYLFSTEAVTGMIIRWAEGASFRREVEGIKPADTIVVLSGMLLDRKDTPLGEWSDAVDRFEGGVDLFQKGKAPLLIFTGGHVPWRPEDRPEGEILKERAVRLGVPADKIVVTGKVGNTAQEAEAVKEMLKKFKIDRPSLQTSLRSGEASEGGRGAAEGGRRDNKQLTANGQQHTTLVGSRQWAVGGKPRIILVTSAFHMRRAKMLFERQGFEVEQFPVDFQTSDRPTLNIPSFIPSAQALARCETAMREGVGMLYYTLIRR